MDRHRFLTLFGPSLALLVFFGSAAAVVGASAGLSRVVEDVSFVPISTAAPFLRPARSRSVVEYPDAPPARTCGYAPVERCLFLPYDFATMAVATLVCQVDLERDRVFVHAFCAKVITLTPPPR